MHQETKPYVKNASDPNQVRDASFKVRRKREQELADMSQVLALESGRRMLWRYLNECGVFKTSFTGSSETFFLEGQRNIGLKIFTDVNEADPQAYVKMMQESKGKENE